MNSTHEAPEAAFAAFLQRLTSDTCSAFDWHHYAVARYRDEQVEAARIRLVRASIAWGPWSWHKVPTALRQLAGELAARLRHHGRL